MNTGKSTPGIFRPLIDRNRCEGKGPCITVCPPQVFVMHTVPEAERQDLTLKGKLKGIVRRWRQAEVKFPERCMACGACVNNCPEKAISLIKAPTET